MLHNISSQHVRAAEEIATNSKLKLRPHTMNQTTIYRLLLTVAFFSLMGCHGLFEDPDAVEADAGESDNDVGPDAGELDTGESDNDIGTDTGEHDAGELDNDVGPDTGQLNAGVGPSRIAISAGGKHSCVLYDDGTVQCWGNGGRGQLGHGESSDSSSPVDVEINNASDLTTGRLQSCAVLDNGEVQCWGDGRNDQIGTETAANKNPSPLTVNDITNATRVSTGTRFSCALLDEGDVQCWGRGADGQLGNGEWDNRGTPVFVEDVDDAQFLSVGGGPSLFREGHACVVDSDQQVSCWGRNKYKQLGDGTTEHRAAPVQVPGITEAIQTCGGTGHTCALLETGTIQCWGWGIEGQLGHGSSPVSLQDPVAVENLSSASAITCGASHTCALLEDRTVRCWGMGNYGQIGDGEFEDRSTPTKVIELNNVVDLSAGLFHNCALTEGGSVFCWGNNGDHRLGSGEVSDHSSTPLKVDF